MSNRLSWNIGPVSNENYLLNILGQQKPAGALVLDNEHLAQRVYAAIGGGLVIHRDWSALEGGEWKHLSPLQKIDQWRSRDGRLIRYDCNEPSISSVDDQVAHVNWMCKLMDLAHAEGIRVCMGNFATGQVQIDWLESGRYDPFLRKLAQYRGFHFLGTHEYSLCLSPWGVGTWQHESLWMPEKAVPVSSWPTLEQLPIPDRFGNFHYWFIRRSDMWIMRARKLEIPPPEIILTEWFLDGVWIGREPSIKAEIKAAYGSGGYPDIRGSNTVRDCWKALYPDLSFEEMLAAQWKWSDSIYPEQYVLACMFGWYEYGEWKDVAGTNLGGSKYKSFHEWLITHSNTAIPPPLQGVLPSNVPYPAPDHTGWTNGVTTSTSDYTNIRQYPTVDSPVVGLIKNNTILHVCYGASVYQNKITGRIVLDDDLEKVWSWSPVTGGWARGDVFSHEPVIVETELDVLKDILVAVRSIQSSKSINNRGG